MTEVLDVQALVRDTLCMVPQALLATLTRLKERVAETMNLKKYLSSHFKSVSINLSVRAAESNIFLT